MLILIFVRSVNGCRYAKLLLGAPSFTVNTLSVEIEQLINSCSSSAANHWPHRLGTELGGEGCSYGGDEEHVQLLVETQEVAEGQDDHFPGVNVQPSSDLCQHRL